MKNVNIIKEGIRIFWIFIIGSVLGYICEMIVGLVQNGYFESRQGVIYGPFTPVYGIGLIVYYIFFRNMKDRNILKVFICSMVLGGAIEYLCSFLQQTFFGTISWDYSKIWFNINGRTSLLHCIYWGIAGVIYIKTIEPLTHKIHYFVQNNVIKSATFILAVFMIINIGISSLAGMRQMERINNVPANGNIDMLLDKYYPDDYLNEIFANKKIGR